MGRDGIILSVARLITSREGATRSIVAPPIVPSSIVPSSIFASLMVVCLIAASAVPVLAQEDDRPTNEKAQKTFKEGQEYLHKRMYDAAVDDFKKADKQDGGHCLPCQRRVVKYGIQAHDWKAAAAAAETMIAEAQTPKEQATAHYHRGVVLFDEGIDKHKQEFFQQAHEELGQALAARQKYPSALFADGRTLAYLMQDDAAKQRFQQFVDLKTEDTPERRRALRYISEPQLARARMAPAFEVTTVDGKKISLDDLQGQVVLIDFWATWCEPCRMAMPHIRDIAREHAEDPMVVLSVSVDKDEKAWRDFIGANKMTWPQYFNDGFGGLAKLYEVSAIPNTFTIDSDGVLQAEHVGDAGIDGKIRKLIARAKEEQAAQRRQSAPALQSRGEEEQ